VAEATETAKLSAHEDALQRRLIALLMKLRDSEATIRECLNEHQRREGAGPSAQHG